MSNKKEFGEGLIFTVSNHLWWWFLGNFYFALFNLPLVILIIGLATGIFEKPAAWFIGLCCLPIGPALSALISVMSKLVREKDISLTKDLFKAYKNNFKQSILFWGITVALLLIVYVDITYFLINQSKLVYFFYFLGILVLLIGFYALVIISRFYLKTSDIFKLSFTTPMLYFKTSLFNLFSLVATAYIFYKIPGFSLLFIISLFCYCVAIINNKLLNDIEEKLSK